MQRLSNGWHVYNALEVNEGAHYGFRLPDGRALRDLHPPELE